MVSIIYLYLIYLFFALTPILIWMFFYFKKDLHPEPKKMIFRVFVLGMAAGCIATIFEMGFLQIFSGRSFLFVILQSFFIVALIEEVLKYLVAKIYVFSSPELDEPLDVMLYMVISALGFAFLENIVLFFAAEHPYAVGAAFSFALLRFFGAMFLHTLTSGAFGYFIALSFCAAENKKKLYFTGFVIAIALHGVFNVAITQLTGAWQYVVPATIVVALAIFTTIGFMRLRKMKSSCKVTI